MFPVPSGQQAHVSPDEGGVHELPCRAQAQSRRSVQEATAVRRGRTSVTSLTPGQLQGSPQEGQSSETLGENEQSARVQASQLQSGERGGGGRTPKLSTALSSESV